MPHNAVQGSKYLLYIAIAFVVVLTVSNTVASKILMIGPFVFSGAIFLFPISYIFGDVLTEVYGYAASRKVIWSGLAALLGMSLAYWFVQHLPAAPFWPNQGAYEAILGGVPRIVAASALAFFVGEISNSVVLSKMKIFTRGKYLWTRTIGSTIVGEGFDTALFITIAFAGTMPVASLITFIWSSYLIKVLYETLATPLTYAVVGFLKRAEGIDTFDYDVNYNPFAIRR